MNFNEKTKLRSESLTQTPTTHTSRSDSVLYVLSERHYGIIVCYIYTSSKTLWDISGRHYGISFLMFTFSVFAVDVLLAMQMWIAEETFIFQTTFRHLFDLCNYRG